MGIESVLIPMLISAAGAGVTAYGANQAANKQDKIAAQGIRQQQARQREADALVNNTLRQTAESNPDADRASSFQDYARQLQATRGGAQGQRQLGAVSGRYGEDSSSAAADINAYGNKYADIFSRLDAPDRQRQREAISFGRLTSDINPIAQAAQSDQFLNDMRIRNVRPNPWLQILAGGLAGSASAFAPGASKGGSGMQGGAKSTPSFFDAPQTPWG